MEEGISTRVSQFCQELSSKIRRIATVEVVSCVIGRLILQLRSVQAKAAETKAFGIGRVFGYFAGRPSPF